jgi:hypothetical protein
MMTNQERDNMIQFLMNYFGGEFNQLMNMSDYSLEHTYNFAYQRKEMESDF